MYWLEHAHYVIVGVLVLFLFVGLCYLIWLIGKRFVPPDWTVKGVSELADERVAHVRAWSVWEAGSKFVRRNPGYRVLYALPSTTKDVQKLVFRGVV